MAATATAEIAAAPPQKTAKEQFIELQTKGINAQTNFFLRTYVQEFSGRFEEVLNLAEEFKKYAPPGGKDEVRELAEDKAHLFLEKRGETLTVKELRDRLNEIDINKNHAISFIEYLLYKYAKTVDDLFAERDTPTSASLLQALEDAIAAFQDTLAVRQARDEKMAELEALAEAGGVKGSKARLELEQMRAADATAQNVAEVQAGAKQRAAQRAVDRDDPFANEQKRLAAEKKRQEEEEKRKREEGKARLKAKMDAMKLA